MRRGLPEERRQLDLIGGTLRAEAPRLAAKFDMFARLARDEGRPPDEKQFRVNRAWRYKAFPSRRARRGYYAVLALALAALVLVLTLGLT